MNKTPENKSSSNKHHTLALIVDDEPDILQLLGITLSRMDILTCKAETITEAKDLLENNDFDFCLTDMRLPDGDGIDLIKHIQSSFPNLPVALITAHGNMDTAVEAMKAGAFDFLSKPVNLVALRSLISNAVNLNKIRNKDSDIENLSNNDEAINTLSTKLSSSTSPPSEIPIKSSSQKKQLIGNSPAMLSLKKMILKLARSQAPVLINGESGTGKELVARLIHHKGPRLKQPFVPVNCGAIPSELMESEFFGHMKGSFTGAIKDKKGLFQMADGGTLFLDEIAELPIAMQVKLLRAIQEKAVRPVGSEHEIPVDTRILSATHRDLSFQVEQGTFRQDLYYRINVIELKVPSLKDRKEDIPQLVEYLFKQMNLNSAASDQILKTRLTQNALDGLMNYPFPGNIRELENILERAVTLVDEHNISLKDLNLPILNTSNNSEILFSDSNRGDMPLEKYLEILESKEILSALKEANGNKTQAAKALGISFRAMRYKLEKLNII